MREKKWQACFPCTIVSRLFHSAPLATHRIGNQYGTCPTEESDEVKKANLQLRIDKKIKEISLTTKSTHQQNDGGVMGVTFLQQQILTYCLEVLKGQMTREHFLRLKAEYDEKPGYSQLTQTESRNTVFQYMRSLFVSVSENTVTLVNEVTQFLIEHSQLMTQSNLGAS